MKKEISKGLVVDASSGSGEVFKKWSTSALKENTFKCNVDT